MAKRLIPCFNRVLVEKIVPPSKTTAGILLPEKSSKLNSGKVVAVGPGTLDKSGNTIPVAVKEGDTVLLPEYGGTEVKLGEKDLMSYPLKRTLPAVPKSLMYSVTQYLLKTKHQMPFHPVAVLNHFVEPLTMAEAFAQGKSLEKKTHFPPFFTEEKSLTEEKKLTNFIRSLTPTKSTTSLSPFFGATSFLARDGVGTYKNFLHEHSREQLLKKLKKRCWNIISNDKTTGLVEKLIDQGETKELTKGVEMMIEIILRNRRIPYGYNYYLNEVKEMKSLLSKTTKTNTLVESVKIKSIYQSAALVAQDICFQMRNKTRSFRAIFRQIVKDVQTMKGVEGIRVCVSGRLGGAEIAKSEVAKYGKTSRISFNRKVDYAAAEVSTRHGITGVKVWISYR